MKNKEIVDKVLKDLKKCLNWKLTEKEILMVVSFLNEEIQKIENEKERLQASSMFNVFEKK